MPKFITKRWVVENGEGHWEVSNGIYTISCDSNELEDTIEEMSEVA